MNNADILLGIVGMVSMSTILYYNLLIIRNLKEHGKVSLTMLFLREEATHSFKFMFGASIFFYGTVTLTGLGTYSNIHIPDLLAKAGAVVFLLTLLIFYEVIGQVTMTPHEQDHDATSHLQNVQQ